MGLIVSGAYTHVAVDPFEQIGRVDLRALLGLSWTLRSGPWQLRPQAGAGALWSRTLPSNNGPHWARSLAVPIEAQVLLGYHLTADWALGVAPVATWYQYVSQRGTDASLGDTDLGVLVELRRGR
jgi:hypothetical protein